jgi:HD-like signal output (HDOD) protein
MPRVLFVDDEPNILQGLRRLLRGRTQEWEMTFATAGEQALEMLARCPVDVIVSDMRMPGMDGPTLLSKVKQRWPSTVRIVLSGQSDQEAVMRSVHEAHQYLNKPCDEATLLQTITRSLCLRSILTDSRLMAVVSSISTLPSLPEVYQRISAALSDQQLSVREIGSLVETDVSLSAKLLQLVNSAFFGQPRRVGSPGDAAVLLGVEILKSLVLGAKLFSSLENGSAVANELHKLFTDAVRVATVARRIAVDLGGDSRTADQAFLAGMLHDVGNLVLVDNMLDAYRSYRVQRPADEELASSEERRLFGADHAEIGAYLLGLWGFADDIVEAVAFHHRPQISPPFTIRPLISVHVACCCVEGRGQQPNGQLVEELGFGEKLPKWLETAAQRIES